MVLSFLQQPAAWAFAALEDRRRPRASVLTTKAVCISIGWRKLSAIQGSFQSWAPLGWRVPVLCDNPEGAVAAIHHGLTRIPYMRKISRQTVLLTIQQIFKLEVPPEHKAVCGEHMRRWFEQAV